MAINYIKEINCKRCNVKVISKAPNRFYCNDCRKIINKQIKKKFYDNFLLTATDEQKLHWINLSKKWKNNNINKVKCYDINFRTSIRGKCIRQLIAAEGQIKRNNYNCTQKILWQELRDKLLLTKGFCKKCNKHFGYMKLTIDHIIPLSKSGYMIYTIDDIQFLCLSCNCLKRDKI